MKRKETYLNLSWPLYGVFVIVGCLFAKMLFDGLEINTKYTWQLPIVAYDLLLLVYGFISCVLVYMIGKIIFAKIAGFKILYANFVLFGFRRESGKMKLIFGGKENYSCRVEIVPQEGKKQNISLALWGGTISTVIAIVLTYTLIFALNASEIIKYFFILSSFFYLFAFIGYMLPVRLDNINDGFRLYLIKKYNLGETYLRNQRNLEALYDSSKEIEYFDYGENNDPLSMEGKIYNYFYAIRNNEDKELLIEATTALSNDYKYIVGEDFAPLGLIAHTYVMCLNEMYDELKEAFWKYDTFTRKTINNAKHLDSFKVGLFIEGKVEASREGLIEIINAIPEAKKKYHYPAQIEAEVDLINKIIDNIYTENPELKL